MTQTSISREGDATQPTGRIAELTETNINQIFGAIDRRPITAPIAAKAIIQDPIIDHASIDTPIIPTSPASIGAGPDIGAIDAIARSTIITAILEIIDTGRRTIIASIFGGRAIGMPG